MYLKKRKLVLLIGILLIFAMVGCVQDGITATDGELPDDMQIPDNGSRDVDSPDEEVNQKEYEYLDAYLAEAYLNLLTEKSAEIAVLNVFGNDTPELLYTYWHEIIDDVDKDFSYPAVSLKIFTYARSEGTELVFDSIVHEAAGGPNNYCVFLTHEGELMLYRSIIGAPDSWGFWQIVPGQSFETTGEYCVGNFNSDLAKLFYKRLESKDERIFQENGKEISEEQYEKAVKGIMGDIDRVIFSGMSLYELDDLWKDLVPFETKSMTYEEAKAWLESQIH